MIDDTTSVARGRGEPAHSCCSPAGWPAGEAHVEITLEPSGHRHRRDASSSRPRGGPGALVPKAVQDPQLHLRNIETLRRLAFLVEGGHARVASP